MEHVTYTKSMTQAERLYTVTQLAATTGESTSIWYRRLKAGVIPHVRIRGSVRVKMSEFEKFMKECERPAK